MYVCICDVVKLLSQLLFFPLFGEAPGINRKDFLRNSSPDFTHNLSLTVKYCMK